MGPTNRHFPIPSSFVTEDTFLLEYSHTHTQTRAQLRGCGVLAYGSEIIEGNAQRGGQPTVTSLYCDAVRLTRARLNGMMLSLGGEGVNE